MIFLLKIKHFLALFYGMSFALSTQYTYKTVTATGPAHLVLDRESACKTYAPSKPTGPMNHILPELLYTDSLLVKPVVAEG